jgi:hypothetical protein
VRYVRLRTDALPPLKEQLTSVRIKSPIEQHMLGSGGLFRQENVEKRRIMSVREWAELCRKDDYRAPGVNDVGLHARSQVQVKKLRRGRKNRDAESAEPETASVTREAVVDGEMVDGVCEATVDYRAPTLPPNSNCLPVRPTSSPLDPSLVDETKQEGGSGAHSTSPMENGKGNNQPKRVAQSRETREANLAERAARDLEFLRTFSPRADWLPPGTSASDYTLEFCQKLERQYWRNCGLGKPAWYGADTQGMWPALC